MPPTTPGAINPGFRVHLELDRPEPDAPRTLIVKIPTGLAKNRALGALLGAYEREIRFYEELSGEVALRTPRCYYADLDPNPLAGREEQTLRFLERIPGWIMRGLYPVFRWLAARSRRRYVLLLEDLAPARVGDQIVGCDSKEAEPILRELAAAQAKLWESPRLESLLWLARIDMLTRMSHAMFRRNRRAFFRQFGDRVPDFLPRLADWLDRNAIRLMKHLGSPPRTLLHGDYRLDNLFFGAGEGMTVIDWQGVGCGRAPFDVAYFITGNLEPDLARQAERGLVRIYHEALVGHGVDDYPYEECWRDYALSKLFLVYRLILGGEMIDLSHERGQRLLDLAISRLCALLPTGDLDTLLDAADAQGQAPAHRAGAPTRSPGS